MNNATRKVKKVSMVVHGMVIGILLGQQEQHQAVARVRASLQRHGWIVPGVHPLALVRRRAC